MLGSVADYLSTRAPVDIARDVVDLAVVYYLVYRALLVMRGTRAMQVGIGLLLVFVLYVASYQLHLVTLLSILGALIPGAVILILVVVFQNDIRRGLMRMGSQPWLGLTRARESQAIDEVVEAATDLAKHRIGALITFEQDANLDEFIGVNKGHVLDAAVSSELLVSIFVPEGVNKLHDGAVIIRDLRIAKAGVFFPMPDSRVLDPSFGSRHRAALGITEETDAVVVIVSEERGTISFCFNGNIVSNLDGPGLRRALEGVFSPRRRPKAQSKREGVPARLGPEPSVPASVRARTETRRAPEVEVPTLLSLPTSEAGETPTTRIRTSETEVDRPSIPLAAPAPLRRKTDKGDKADKPGERQEKEKGDKPERPAERVEAPEPPEAETAPIVIPGAGAVPKLALTTPMRAPGTPLAPRVAPAGDAARPAADEGRSPDSGDGVPS